ncbi:hypothetical protein SEUCBS139899_002010 [Sporothrix eucalyptigena]|uniref:Uncharacterized protein n=1 Tax=Sporothrix eucalyptigena TaxID=1812306 RepID=A0ABP0CDJ4_9PEZI
MILPVDPPVNTPVDPPVDSPPVNPFTTPRKSVMFADDSDLDSRLRQASRNASEMERLARERIPAKPPSANSLEQSAQALMSFSPRTPLSLRTPLYLPTRATGYSPGCRLPYPGRRATQDGVKQVAKVDTAKNDDEDSNSDKEGTTVFLERMGRPVSKASSTPSKLPSKSSRSSPKPFTKSLSPASPSPSSLPIPGSDGTVGKNGGKDGDKEDLSVKPLLYPMEPVLTEPTVTLQKKTTMAYGTTVRIRRTAHFVYVYRQTVFPPAA